LFVCEQNVAYAALFDFKSVDHYRLRDRRGIGLITSETLAIRNALVLLTLHSNSLVLGVSLLAY
jgi:hypothetical protein